MGEAIALLTVLCWTLSIQCFAAASKRIGSVPVNIIRISAALLFFSLLHYFRQGGLVPLSFPLQSYIYLGLSGILGFFLGDIFLFKALVELGPRITMLIQSLAAPTAAVIGWFFLQETYLLYQWLGMCVTLAGVSLVVLERSEDVVVVKKIAVRRVSLSGVVYALLAMVGQATGLIFSKIGMQTEDGYLDAFGATQIRAIAAFICFLLFITVTRRWSRLGEAIRDRKALWFTVTGAAVGPFLGVSLSLLALHYLSAGIASTFFSLIPICIIPFSVYLHKEHVSMRAIGGACIAVFGVWLLMG